MATTIYLSSGDDFTVREPYEQVVALWSDGARAELTAIWWTDPESSKFDPLDTWPTYRESRVTIDLSAAVAVEGEDAAQQGAIERARLHGLMQD